MINLFLPDKAATVETLGHPAAGVIGWFDASSNTTGETVNEDTALTVSAVWCAMRIISETLATLPCIMYRRVSEDNRERAVDDYRYRLVHDMPHPAMAPVSFYEAQTAHLVISGNCYAKMVIDGGGIIRSFEPRSPSTVTMNVDDSGIYYDVSDPKETLDADEMLHVPGLGGDGLQGWSVVKNAQQSIGLGMAADKFSGSQLGNGAMPSGILSHPARLKKEARENYRREWNEIHKGADKAGKIGIIHGGMEFQALSMSNEDAQFLESRKFTVREIARWFRLPPHMLADLEDSSVRANIEQQAIEFVVYSMRPWLIRWEQTLNRKLLADTEQSSLYFEFLIDSLLRGDTTSRYEAYAQALQNGWLSVNEVRRRENLNSIDGGNTYLSPLNMVPANRRDDVPDTVKDEFQKNLTESLNAIVNQARGLREEISQHESTVSDAMAAVSVNTHSVLSSLRADRELIRRDLEPQPAQVRGCDLEGSKHAIRNVALSLIRESLGNLAIKEKTQINRAATAAMNSGKSFVDWLDNYYDGHGETVVNRIFGPVVAFCTVTDRDPDVTAKDIATEWCAVSRLLLLDASGGPLAEFLDRIHAVSDGLTQRVKDLEL